MGGHWHPLIGTCHSKWLETAGINWHRIDLYLCRRGLKFIVSCNQEQCLILMLIFVKFWWLRAKIQGGGGGGLTPKGIVENQTHFVFGSYWVGPSIWPSFIQIGAIACVTPAWSSHGHSLNNSQQKVLPFLFKDFLLFSGRVESRENICIIEHHLIDRNHTCMYLAKSHLSTAYVLRDRPPPITFLLNRWGPMP